MSGRPYARNLRAPFAGATDLEAVLPHSFRVSAPAAASGAKQRAIRSAIRRRCVEKNWKKMFSLRHRRLAREEEEVEGEEGEEEAPAPAEEAVVSATPSPEDKSRAEEEERKEKQRQEEEQLAAARLQLEELKKKLTELTDQKHGKFLLLKQILVQEARSKTSAPGSSGSAAKKRRLDDAGGFSPLPSGAQPADASTPGSIATGESN